MGLFDWLFKKENVDAAKNYDSYFRTFTAYEPHFTTWNGEIYESDLVRAAIDARARSIAKLKVEILGSAKPALTTQLKQAPNTWQTWYQFLYRTSTILDLHNTAVIVPVYSDFMEVVGYYTVLPTDCAIVEYDGVPWLRYRFRDGSTAADRLDACAILTKFQYKSDFFGETNNALEPTLKLIHSENEGIETAIKNSARYSFLARVNNFSNTKDLKAEQNRFSELNFREDSGGGLLLFPNTYTDIKQIEQHAYKVDEEERNFIRQNVFNYFAVNDDILQSKAYGDKWAAFYEGVTENFAIQFSETMTKAAYTPNERSRGAAIMATSNRLQYMSTAEKLNVSSQMADRGIMNRDEIREIWNLPPLPNGAGQAYTIRGEYYLMNADGSEQGKENND